MPGYDRETKEFVRRLALGRLLGDVAGAKDYLELLAGANGKIGVIGDSPVRMKPILGLAPDLNCPLLGLFGKENRYPSPESVATLDDELTRLGKGTNSIPTMGPGIRFSPSTILSTHAMDTP